MRCPPRLVLTLALMAGACHALTPGPEPDPAALVEGRAPSAVADTVEGGATVAVERAAWRARPRVDLTRDFWSDVAALDLLSAETAVRTMDERTFLAALQRLLGGDPEAAGIAFSALTHSARDPLVRSRARVGLTMALSWSSDWPALAALPPFADSTVDLDSLSALAGVERWGRALAAVQPPVLEIPREPVTLPLRRSAVGTPVLTVLLNGRPHEFWLDTGASMTLVSASIAAEAGVKLASTDSLALGVVGGHIPARAIYIDSLALGAVRVRGLGAALVNPDVLRLDRQLVHGALESVRIDGVIGTDLLRRLDIVIDAGAETITLARPRRLPRSTRNLFWVGYPVVRFLARGGRPVLFGLDTGAEGSYVTTAFLRKVPRTRIAARRGALSGLGAHRERTAWVAREVAVSDGEYAMSLVNVPVSLARQWTFLTFDGVIGSDIALATRLHLDFENGIFDVRPSALADSRPKVTIGH